MTRLLQLPLRAEHKKVIPENGYDFFRYLRSAAAAVATATTVAAPAVIAAAAPDDDQQDDDPAAVAATKTVIAHIGTSYEM